MTIHSFTFGPLYENTYVVHDRGEAMILDPGCSEPAEEKELADYIERNNLQVRLLVNTHCHVDHVLGNYFVKQKYKVPFRIHRLEEMILSEAAAYAFDLNIARYRPCSPDSYLEENEEIVMGNSRWKVLEVPGHSPGHVAFYNEKESVVLSGDVLFDHSIGRCDLTGGDYDTLINSIHRKLFTLPDEVKVYAGHGGTTFIGREKKENPYCALN